MDNSTSGAVFGILLVAALAYSDALGDLTDETISYPAQCRQDGNHRNCYTLGRVTYRVRPASSDVVYWLSDVDYSTPRHLANCSIIDSENWQCMYLDGYGPVVMIDGLKAKTRADGAGDINLRWWQWYALKFLGSRYFSEALMSEQITCVSAGIGPYPYVTCAPGLTS